MTMETNKDDLCCGCLSSGRKMRLIKDYFSEDEILSFFNEIPIQTDDFPLWFCWECKARLTNFAKFKEQMRTSWAILQNFVKGHQRLHPKSLSKLTIATQMWFDKNMVQKCSSDIKMNCTVKMAQDKDDLQMVQNGDDHILQNNDDDKMIQTTDITINENSDKIKINKNNYVDVKMNLESHMEEFKVKVEDYSDDDRTLIDICNDKKVKKQVKKEKKVKAKKINKEVMYEEITLSKEEILEDRAAMKSKEEYLNAMFKCEQCIIPYASGEDLKDHEAAKHSLVSRHTCEYCGRGFPSGGALAAHARRHAVRWRCVACRHRSAGVAAAAHHYTTTHAPGEIYELAAKAFGTYEGKTQESGENSSPKSSAQHPCPQCDKSFRWKTSLRKHAESHRIAAGAARRPHCEPCGLSFTSPANLRKHLNTSSKHQIMLKLRKLKGDAAGEADPGQQARDIESIKSSINSQKQQYPCPQCEKRFQWKGNLLRHLQSHAARANGELVCSPCNRTFSSIATYQQHMKISRKHVTEDEFKHACGECGRRFANKIKLRDHVDWEHLQRYTHACTHCQKVFKSHTSLYLHRQVVHRVCNAEHLCDHCGKSFPNKTKLRSHVTALHTRDSPYKCATCSARFSWHSCLSRHVRRVHADRAGARAERGHT